MNDEFASSPLVSLQAVELTLGSDAGPVDILRGIDLSVGAGETLGIVGPSGSGKTSLLMIIAGLERATRGDVRIDGQSFTGLDEDALARIRGTGIGIVFQDFHLILKFLVVFIEGSNHLSHVTNGIRVKAYSENHPHDTHDLF